MHFTKPFYCFKLLVSFMALGFSSSALGQLQTSYTINVKFEPEEETLYIKQKVRIFNNGSRLLDSLYFNDWPSAFQNTDTPLSHRLAEEFDRSFYLSNTSKLGSTNGLYILQNDTPLSSSRLSGQQDLFKVALKQPLAPADSTTIQLRYRVKIPNARFTGYGASGNSKSFNLRHWYVALSPYTNEGWKTYSNLNLDDSSLTPSSYAVTVQYPKNFTLFSNLKTKAVRQLKGAYIKQELAGAPLRAVKLVLQQNTDYFKLTAKDGFELVTNIKEEGNTTAYLQANFEKIYRFLETKVGPPKFNKQLVSIQEYNKNPFYGLSQLPDVLSPFDLAFVNEIKLMKTFAIDYLASNLFIDQRHKHWIIEGLHVYLAIKYIEEYYPNKKFIGRLGNISILRKYAFSKMEFNEGFRLFADQMLRLNNYQPLITSKVDLIRYNERIGIPYMAGLAFKFLETYIGQEAFDSVLKKLLNASSAREVEHLIRNATPKNLDGFFNVYLKKNTPLDFKLKRSSKANSLTRLEIQRDGFEDLPVQLSFLKDGQTIQTQWVAPGVKTVMLPDSLKADFAVLNHQLGLPELNRKNNRVALDRKRVKSPVKFTFIKDIEDPKYSQVFYNPLTGFNLYDGWMFGVRLNNKKIGIQNFNFDFRPDYSTYENTLVGSFATTYRKFSYDKKNYLTLFSLFGNTFHYAPNKRYYVLAPNISFLFRKPYLRTNEVQALNFSLFKVDKFGSISPNETPEYSVFKTQYLYSNKGSINFFTANTGLEFAQNFTKIDATLDYRKLFPSGRQFQFRTFAGLFFNNKTGPTSYFDFNLNRPNDYLYQYDFFGRSESSGIYGQQFVMAEGGFKSIIENTNANQWMLSTNLTMGIWRWVEAYLDFAVLKNKGSNVQNFYGTGIRLNILPDYLEVFFPFAASTGWEITSPDYTSKIRFVLSIRGSQLKNLFSRTWF